MQGKNIPITKVYNHGKGSKSFHGEIAEKKGEGAYKRLGISMTLDFKSNIRHYFFIRKNKAYILKFSNTLLHGKESLVNILPHISILILNYYPELI